MLMDKHRSFPFGTPVGKLQDEALREGYVTEWTFVNNPGYLFPLIIHALMLNSRNSEVNEKMNVLVATINFG